MMTPCRSWPRWAWMSVAAAGIALVGAGSLLADSVTRPLDVHLRTQIEIYQQGPGGRWEKIDEIRPTTHRFQATLLEMAQGTNVGSDFVFRARTRKGRDYSARLVEPASLSFHPTTGQLDADLAFEISLDGKSARVEGRLTTEQRNGPTGQMRGKRANGVLGRGPTTVTLVSANRLELEGEPPMLLVCEEEYRLVPRGGGPPRTGP